MITLYHGSSSIIENPRFDFCNTHNDFGKEFY
ncbi:MAG: hypothetical protein DBY31_01955 [Succinivibrio sp.]|nr:MAG: hypothetical protein DBY31_01955 [Succinivibrio sp.]